MKIHITNLYNFDKNDQLVKQQHRFADSGRSLGFYEMSIFSYPVEMDTAGELSKRLDGIIAALEAEDVVMLQLPTGNGYHYERILVNKIKAYRNTKIVLLFHDIQMFSQDEQKNYMDLCKIADVVILPSDKEMIRFQSEGITQLLSSDDIMIADKVSDWNGSTERIGTIESSGYISLCQEDFYIKKLLLDAVEKVYLYQKGMIKDITTVDEDEIQIGFGLHDKTGNYSMWVGVAMQSIIEHTNSKISFHILIDDTVNESNRKRLTEVAMSGGQRIQFHLIDRNIFREISSQMGHYTIGAIFRVMLPEILHDVTRIIYLDADILVNRDVKELWDTDISNYCIAAVKDAFVINGVVKPIVVKKGLVLAEDYFNSGVIFMNLNNIRNNGSMRNLVTEYLLHENSTDLPDQDALNVIYNKQTYYLDGSWNYFARPVQERGERELKKCLYHFVGTRCILYSLSAMDQLYYETLGRTPWKVDGCKMYLEKALGRVNDRVEQLENVIIQIAGTDKKRIFYGEENYAMRNMYNLINLRENDYRVLYNPIQENNVMLPCVDFSCLQEEKEDFVVFVLPEADGGSGVERLQQMGLVNGKDFFVIRRLLPPEKGGYI